MYQLAAVVSYFENQTPVLMRVYEEKKGIMVIISIRKPNYFVSNYIVSVLIIINA